jgi:hypothetical protein
MNDRGKKWLLWGSLLILVLSIAGIIYLSIITYTKIVDKLQLLCAIIMVLSALNFFVLFSIRFIDRKWLKKMTLISIFLLPPFAIGVYFLGSKTNVLDSELVAIPAIVLLCLLIISSLVYIFIIRKIEEMRGIVVLLIFIVISILLQRINISSSLINMIFVPGFILLTAVGLYMYGIICLFAINKNGFLKTVSFLACTITAFGSFIFFLKMTGEKVENMELMYFIPAFIMTLVVLLSLPISGYIRWNLLHKRIFKKVAIAWVFFLLIFSIRFIYPDLFTQMVFKESKEYPEFFLKDYKIPDKNGLE